MQKTIEYATSLRDDGNGLEKAILEDIPKIQEAINKIPSNALSSTMKENLINRLDFIKLKQKDVTYKIPTIEPKNVMAKTIARIVFVGLTLCRPQL